MKKGIIRRNHRGHRKTLRVRRRADPRQLAGRLPAGVILQKDLFIKLELEELSFMLYKTPGSNPWFTCNFLVYMNGMCVRRSAANESKLLRVL